MHAWRSGRLPNNIIKKVILESCHRSALCNRADLSSAGSLLELGRGKVLSASRLIFTSSGM
jgi:hypothetical protein